jgi:two-component system sensor histidine kinase DegS
LSKKDLSEFNKINYYLGVIVFIVMGIGILIFSVLGFFLSGRIIKLKNFAVQIGEGNFSEEIEIKTRDEIASLAASFNKMARALKDKIEMTRKLSYLEERDRIAMEFHDGLAQNLADIIKRLELLERLFKIDPQKAFLELEGLKKNTRDVLNKTRHAIADLKSPEKDFNLLEDINNYIIDYRAQNNINVQLDVSGSFQDLAKDKVRSIFYIIREALTNVKRHAQAKNIGLRLGYSNNHELAIEITDDGKGFDVKAAESSASSWGKWGLSNMRQRAVSLGGRLIIESGFSKGTRICVDIPV